MEMKDDQPGDESSDDGTEIHILSVSENNTMERPYERRRTQSLTKSSSTGFGEESDSIAESDVFHSRTASNASSICEAGLYGSSRSEDNLLQHSNKYSNNGISGSKVENDFLKYTSELGLEERSSDSNESLKYNPFESPDVQALLKPSKPPSTSLPHTYPRPSKALPVQPTRQMSDGEIKPLKPVFSVGSPPFDSPISFQSIDKSISMASSQGSFSEGIVEDMSSPSEGFSSKRSLRQGGGDGGGREEQGADEKEHIKKEEPTEKEDNNDCSTTNTTDDHRSSLLIHGDDIPLPDDSPVIVNPKLMRNHHKHSLSRDSGLSDSPDPFVDLSSSPSHGINSNILTDRLSQMTKTQLSPLVNRNQASKNTDKLPDNTKKFQELLQTTTTTTKPRPQKLTKHVVRVMRITPSLDNDNDNIISPPATEDGERNNSQSSEVQRLRMASPDELLNPSERQLGFSMKRSLSQGVVLKSDRDGVTDDSEEIGTRRIGELIISEAKVGHMASRTEHKDFNVSRSLENILDNF